MKTFESPQTGSVYTIANTGDVFVSFREIGEGVYRVRIQGDEDALKEVQGFLNESWGEIKAEDHLSIVVNTEHLPNAVGDAVRAVTRWQAQDQDQDDNKFDY